MHNRTRPSADIIATAAGLTMLVAVAIAGATGLHRTAAPAVAQSQPALHESTPARSQTTAFVAPGAMATARAGATATLLADGRVLVAGGQDAQRTYLASAEIFSPLTGEWTDAGSMTSRRVGHTATLLPDGRVLVTGGRASGGCALPPSLASAETFDPATGAWTASGAMVAGRAYQSAFPLADGRVLVAGGLFGAPDQNPPPFIELYDPSTGSWQRGAAPQTTSSLSALTLLSDGRVLAAGGDRRGYNAAAAELYDAAHDAWMPTGHMVTEHPRLQLIALADGGALALDGTKAERYDPASNAWRTASGVPSDLFAYSATLLTDGRVLIAGGYTNGDAVRTATLYDPATDAWQPAADLTFARTGHTATLLQDGRVLVAGGDTERTEVYDPGADRWHATGEQSAGAEEGGCVKRS